MTDAGTYVVAVTRLATSVEAEAQALAADLGTLALEERLKLAAGLPAIVLSTADVNAAGAMVAKLLSRGHRALSCRLAEVVDEEDMVSLKQLGLAPQGLKAGEVLLPWDEVSALIVARKKRTTESRKTVKEKKFDVGRSLLSGGLINRKTEKREVVVTAEESEQVLYVFRASGEPWILRERGTNYAALGAALSPVAAANFAAAVKVLRERAPHARFDDSLLRRRGVSDVDLFAHLLAM